MTALADEFTTMFRDEHRRVRDLLLEVIAAFEARDRARIEATLAETAAQTGPHFRYEEESLYPSLVAIFGREYIDHLYSEHDAAIERSRKLVDLARGPIDDEDVAEATGLVRQILPHVSDCDGLSVMVEVMADEEVASIFAARERSLGDGLDLFAWADGIRRPAHARG